jgi:hypothetical protein
VNSLCKRKCWTISEVPLVNHYSESEQQGIMVIKFQRQKELTITNLFTNIILQQWVITEQMAACYTLRNFETDGQWLGTYFHDSYMSELQKITTRRWESRPPTEERKGVERFQAFYCLPACSNYKAVHATGHPPPHPHGGSHGLSLVSRRWFQQFFCTAIN